jgi:hypothetical protein
MAPIAKAEGGCCKNDQHNPMKVCYYCIDAVTYFPLKLSTTKNIKVPKNGKKTSKAVSACNPGVIIIL